MTLIGSRACGQIFCETCCSEMRIVAQVSSWKTSRVCVDCAQKIDASNLPKQEHYSRRTSSAPTPGPSIKHLSENVEVIMREQADTDADVDVEDGFDIDAIYDHDRQNRHGNITSDPPQRAHRRKSQILFSDDDHHNLERIRQIKLSTVAEAQGEDKDRQRKSRSGSLTAAAVNVDGVGRLRKDLDGSYFNDHRRSMSFSSFDNLAAQLYAEHSALTESSKGEDFSRPLTPPYLVDDSASKSQHKKAAGRDDRSKESKKHYAPMTSIAQYLKKSSDADVDRRVHGGRAITPPPAHRDTNRSSIHESSRTRGVNRFSAEWEGWDSR
jgi:hypothetical protein